MVLLKAKIRDKFGRKTHSIRKQGFIPAVLYGAEIKNLSLEVDRKEFENVYKQAGESSLITLAIAKGEDESKASSPSDEAEGKKFSVLIHQIARNPITGEFLHVDFYHPSTKKKVEAEIALVFEGEAPAVKELGGTLEKELQTIEVKGLAQDLPREIKVNVENLKTFEDRILIQDLKIPERVEVLKNPEEMVVHVTPPEKVEEELVAEEKVEEEKAEEEKVEGEKVEEIEKPTEEARVEKGKEKKRAEKSK